ncbi:MAG: ATP-binding protein [Defluviitaleaceae bacterium]|nr:ATP-binding protein [Defluviitaleaceae bacterium]
MVIRENYLSKIRPFIGKDIIKVLTGVRRGGKSVLLQQIIDEINSSNTIFLNFEDLGNQHLCEYNAFHDFICSKIGDSKEQFYLFFDEIQEVKGWEKTVNSLRVKFKADIYITGSNSRLLSGELATYIAGRYVSFVIYPFSFAEFKDVNQVAWASSSRSERPAADYTFDEYIQYGGMPFLSSIGFEPSVSKNYLQDVFNSVMLKDIVKRNNIRDVDLLERIISYALANIGKSFSATSISKFFKDEKRAIAPETVLNYLKWCEEAYLFYRLKSQDINGKKMLRVNEKYYVVDHGLREAIVGANLQSTEIILENIVGLELLRRGYKICVGRVGEKEIDFVGEKNGDKLYIQVCYLLDKESTILREFGSLLEVKDNYPKFVLYKESSFMGNYEGIPAMKIEDWLMES